MTGSSTRAAGVVSLRDAWELRNAAATTLIKTEEQVQQLLQTATVEQLVSLLEAFSPARSPGPEWTRSFDALSERLWAWCDPATLKVVEADFRARGQPWAAVANSLTPERGEVLRGQLRRTSAAARMPTFTLG
jgi:hypothetical protein